MKNTEEIVSRPLSRIVVLDLTRVRSGPTAVRQLADCYESEDYLEGQRAFVEKRAPTYKGR